MNNVMRRFWPLLLFLGLAVLILGPALSPGYLLRFDMVFAPHVYFDLSSVRNGTDLATGLVAQSLLYLASLILPMDIVQKLLLIGILAGAGLAMYIVAPSSSRIAKALAGVLYVVNPFVYDRLMAGHWLLLLGYALLPLAFCAFQNHFARPSSRTLGLSILAWAAIAAIDPHQSIMIGVLFIGMATALVRSRRGAAYAAATVAGTVIASLWWIVPQLLAPHGITYGFSLAQYYAFATLPDPRYGLIPHMLGLQGFWHRGWITIDSLVIWPLAWLVLMVPVLVGLVMSLRRIEVRQTTYGLLVTCAMALLVAAGPSPHTYIINTFIFTHVPGMAGLREPEKILELLTLAYAYFLAYGISHSSSLSRRAPAVLAVIAAIGIATLSWPMFWGAHAQLRPVAYPPSWYTLAPTDPHAGILILPFAQYVDDSFAKTLVATPGKTFFGPRAIQSNELILPNLPHEGAFQYPDIETLTSSRNPDQWKVTLGRRHIRYIVEISNHEPFDDSFLIPGVATLMAADPTTRILKLTN